ncbi:MAG: hypothetical protein GC137_00800 [Alphaproteobacteria bacterium]|nr:hypothetical protein [Alphaproteobacteria bacterium]
MLPDEIFAGRGKSEKFEYAHPLNHVPVDDGSLRARLAYDLMAFMKRNDCNYFINPDIADGYNPMDSDDEVDIMIVDGFYKEAEILVERRLKKKPDCEKTQFQKAFLQHLKQEYSRLLDREEDRLKEDPKDVNAMINKGVALANLNRESEALKITNKALKVDPENLNILANKAYIAKLLGMDDVRELALAEAYNITSRKRLEQLEMREAGILQSFGAIFSKSSLVDINTPSAFEEFNRISGTTSNVVH